MASAEVVTCERDGVPTKLTCVQCRTPICPQCLVKTPVGMKCGACGDPGATARRKHNRWIRLAPLGVVVVVTAALSLPRLFSSSSSSKTNAEQNPIAGNPRFTPPVNAGRVGVEVRDGDLAFTVSSFQCGASQVTNGTLTRVAQGMFCFMVIDIHNTGRNPATFLEQAQMLRDAQQRFFGPDLAATTAHPDNAGHDLSAVVVNPGNQVHGVLVFDVPPNETPTYVNLHAGPTGPGAYVGFQSS